MLAAWIMELVLLIAPQYDIPPMLIAAIIIKESQGNVLAIGINYDEDGNIKSLDRGLMQLNSSWFNGDWQCAETNIRAGIIHLKQLYEHTKRTSPYYWAAVVSYNCGLRWYVNNEIPPLQSIVYANSVLELWAELCPIRAKQVGWTR